MSEICSICLENMNENNIELICKHSFHIECIEKYYGSDFESCPNSCPYCRCDDNDIEKVIINKIDKLNLEYNSLLLSNIEMKIQPLSYDQIIFEIKETKKIILNDRYIVKLHDDGSLKLLYLPNDNSIDELFIALELLCDIKSSSQINITKDENRTCFEFMDKIKTKKNVNWQLLSQYNKEIYQQQIAQNT
uniref:RING-type domain-containing protein n=1 Tax=viral metagenome TaxID=1070528 RepID=A0A6C0H5V8_9ZZZZ